MKRRRSRSAGLLYARFSKADLAAVRAIKASGKSAENPDGLTGGEKVVLDHILRLSRKEGYSFATNERLGKDLGVSRRSVEGTLHRLRKKGWVFQGQEGSKLTLAMRFVVTTKEQRAKLTDLFGEPGENWSVLVESAEEFLSIKCGTDCSGSDKSSPTDNLPSSFPQSRERSEKSSLSTNLDAHSGASSTPPPGPCESEVGPLPPKPFVRGEVPPRAFTGLELTARSSIPSRVSRDDWLAYLVGTPELQIFLNIYGEEATVENDSFLRSLGRSIRRGRFVDCPDLFNFIRRMTTCPTDAHGNFIAPCELLRNLDQLAHDYVLESGASRFETLSSKEHKMETGPEVLLADFDKFEKSLGDRAMWSGLTETSIRYKGPKTEPFVYSLDARRHWHGSPSGWEPEWFFFLLCIQRRPDWLHHWAESTELRQRLLWSLLIHASIIPVIDLMVGGKLSTYTGHMTDRVTAAHDTLLGHIKQAKLDLYRSNRYAVYLQREQAEFQRYAA